jgi:hypothetical protein
MISVKRSETGTGGFGHTDRDGIDGFGQRVGRMFLRDICVPRFHARRIPDRGPFGD